MVASTNMCGFFRLLLPIWKHFFSLLAFCAFIPLPCVCLVVLVLLVLVVVAGGVAAAAAAAAATAAVLLAQVLLVLHAPVLEPGLDLKRSERSALN